MVYIKENKDEVILNKKEFLVFLAKVRKVVDTLSFYASSWHEIELGEEESVLMSGFLKTPEGFESAEKIFSEDEWKDDVSRYYWHQKNKG